MRLRRPRKPEFALAGILVGLFAGEAIALVVEVALAHPSRWLMLGGWNRGRRAWIDRRSRTLLLAQAQVACGR